MELFCEYDHKQKILADHQCDYCGKLLCKICGYTDRGIDYCNECWQKKEERDEFLKKQEIESQMKQGDY